MLAQVDGILKELDKLDLQWGSGERQEGTAMAEKQRVEVEILGQKYTIRSEAEPEYVRELAAYRREARAGDPRGRPRARTRRGSWPWPRSYIADELFRLREERKSRRRPRT